MPGDRMKNSLWKPQVSEAGIASLRVFQFLMGAMVLGFILICTFLDFLRSHPGLTVLSTVAYLVLCTFGVYFKIAQAKVLTTHHSK